MRVRKTSSYSGCLETAEMLKKKATKATGQEKANLHVQAFYYRRKAKRIRAEMRIDRAPIKIVKRRQPSRYLKVRKSA